MIFYGCKCKDFIKAEIYRHVVTAEIAFICAGCGKRVQPFYSLDEFPKFPILDIVDLGESEIDISINKEQGE